MNERILLNDTRPQYQHLKSEIDEAVARVLERGWFIHGDEHRAFESEFASYCGARHGIGVANGTDAIRIAIQALEIGPGDEVITVANAGIPPVAAIRETGARPVFADVDPATRTIDPKSIESRLNDRTRAVLGVHLYGHAFDVDEVLAICQPRGIRLVEDCAQAHGATYKGRRVGSLGHTAAFSFYPTKNLGAYGDGGMVLTNHDDVAERARLLRQYGWRTRYTSEIHGLNSRLDEMQAAILRVKLRHLDKGNTERRDRAKLYAERLSMVATPSEADWATHVFHLYVIETERRDDLKSALAERGIGTDVHYPTPAHLQAPYAGFGEGLGSLPVTERQAARVLSLPMFPELPARDIERVAHEIGEIQTQLVAKPV